MSWFGSNLNKRKSLIIMLVLILSLSLSGCKVQKKDIDNKNIIQGQTYTRELIEIGNGENIFDICKDTQGGFYVVTEDKNLTKKIWHIDGNSNLEKLYDINEMLNIDNNTYCEAFVSPDGGTLVGYGSNGEYIYIDSNGKISDINLELPELDASEDNSTDDLNDMNHLLSAKFYNNYIYVVDANYNIHEINKSDYSVKLVFENTDFEYLDNFCVYDRMIIAWTYDTICYEGIDDHKQEEEMYYKFKDFFELAKKTNKELCVEIDNEKVWALCGDKIYRLDLNDNNITESKVVGTGSNEYIINQIVVDDDLLVMVRDYVDKKCKLYKYTVNDNTAIDLDVETRKLKIWCLFENANCMEAVRYFTDKYPNVEVEVEVGMLESENTITELDAIKNLNSEILSGEAPDIMYMDGVNPSKYIESGELLELSDVVDEFKDSGDYFNNILDTFNNDGKIYVVPASFSFIAKIGTEADIEASRDIKEFVKYLVDNKNEKIMYDHMIMHYLLYYYYRDIKPDIENGNLNREELVDFFEAAKQMQDMAEKKEMLNLFYMRDYSIYASMYDGTFRFLLANIPDVEFGLWSCGDMVKQINGKMELPAEDYKNNYICSECIAVSSKTDNVDLAKEFLKIALGEKCQSGFYGATALRVNKKGFEEYNAYQLEMDDPSENERQFFEKQVSEFEEIIEKLNVPIYVDNVLDQMIVDELNNVLFYNKDKEEAIDNYLEKIQIYKSE